MNVNTNCQIFYNQINKLLDETAPYKKLTKKETSLKISPWITQGILKSIKIRDQLYKSYSTEKIPNKKIEIYQKYKKYRNIIVSLIRKSKKRHYSEYFLTHNANIKKTWDGIRELIDISKKKSFRIQMINHNNKSITDNKQIADTFNDFYANLGKNIEKNIPKGKKKFMEYLNNPLEQRFFAEPCDDAEIISIIFNFGANKSSGPNSIPTNILKEFCHLLVKPIKTLVNKSLAEGTLQFLRLPKSVLSIKRQINLSV